MLSPEFISQFGNAVISALIASGRMLGLFMIFPLFSWTGIKGTVRAMVALALGIPAAIMIYPSIGEVNGASAMIIFLMIKEVIVGAGLGLLVSIPFWASQAAGDLIDSYRGASQPNFNDPTNAAETTVSGTMLLLITLALFVVADGFQISIGLVYETYSVWRPLTLVPELSADILKLFMRILSEIMRQAVVMAGPVLICMAVAELTLLFISRGWKQFNATDLSAIGKNLAFALLLPVYGIFFMSYLENGWGKALVLIRQMVPEVR
jgi:type III secretion protein T